MNRYIIHIAYLCLTFFLLASCNKQEDAMPQDEGMVTLSISAAMISRSGDSDETGDENRTYDELMHTLRIIIFDEKGDKEGDRLIDFIEEEKRGLFETTKPEYFIVKANEKKTIYLLANCEDILKDKEISITNLDAIELKTEDEWFSGQPQNKDFLLPATAKYTISVGKESKDLGTLYLAHAANKISFEFTNKSGQEITISEWRLTPIAQNSYLIPHITDENENTPEKDRWYSKVWAQYKNADLSGDDEGVTNYDIPDDADQDTFNEELEKGIKIAAGESATLYSATKPFYLHESKADSDPTTGQQQYTVSCVINGRVYDAVLPNLPSLFRGTYVKIKAIINALNEDEPYEGIYAEIVEWKEYDPVTGEIVEEETDTNP